MKFRITYKDNYQDHKTLIYEASSFWHAKEFGQNVFKERYVDCENIEDVETPTETSHNHDYDDMG